MKIIFEVKYIAIKWHDSEKPFKIDEALVPVPIEVKSSTLYNLEIQAYTRILNGKEDGQIAFHIYDVNSKIEPYFIDASGNKIPLRKIYHAKKEWWIEDGIWLKTHKCRSSPLWNHVGDAKIIFGSVECNLKISSSSFNREQLNLYLNDFKNDFWYLILKKDSITQGEAGNVNQINESIDDVLIKHLVEFIKNTEKVLKNPKKELRETQSKKDIKKVKPVSKTFMEIAIRGFQKKLTSRDTVESYNVSENKYVHYVVQQVYTIISYKLSAHAHMKNIYKNKYLSEQKRLDSFTNTKTIDSVVFENQILKLEIDVEEENKNLQESVSNQDHAMNIHPLGIETIFLRLENRTNSENKLEFFGTIKRNITDEWVSFQENMYIGTPLENSFYMISFDQDIFTNVIKKNCEYKITGYIIKSKFPRNQQTGFKLKRYFQYISSIEILESPSKKALRNKKEKKEIYKRDNWIKNLRPDEEREQDFEKEALKKSIDSLQTKELDSSKLVKELKFNLVLIKKLLVTLKKLNITQDSYFSNSMIFVQNPNYQAIHMLYKKIKDHVGINEHILSYLDVVEKIGLIDIPKIYEKWCLLQIIKILIDTYKFIPEKDWKKNMANQILSFKNLEKVKNINIKFYNKKIGRDIDLWYEYELQSKKRPDYVLDIKSRFGTNKNHRLIMDAKFKENVNIECLINALYPSLDENNITKLDSICPKENGKISKKNYSEYSKNTVFILHPDTDKSIKDRQKVTSKLWGSDAYYGELNMFDFKWDKDKSPIHKYGSILVSPITKYGSSLDNLQRLIGMAMQYNLEINNNITFIVNNDDEEKRIIDPEPKEKIFCLVCGSDKFHGSRELNRRGNGYNYRLSCDECSHFYTYNYCWKCHLRLIKNGEYWSYHSAEVDEPFNIICPRCSGLLGE